MEIQFRYVLQLKLADVSVIVGEAGRIVSQPIVWQLKKSIEDVCLRTCMYADTSGSSSSVSLNTRCQVSEMHV